MERVTRARKIVLTGLFAALAVLLSGVHFPVGPIKAFPFQHTVNIIAGIMLGPWYAALAAMIAGIIRNALGTGTPFAFPGGIPGAVVVGLFYRWLRRDWVAWTEPLGTGFIGVTLTVFLLAPLIGKELAPSSTPGWLTPFIFLLEPVFGKKLGLTFLFIFAVFMASSLPGTVIGYFLFKALRRAKVLERSGMPAP